MSDPDSQERKLQDYLDGKSDLSRAYGKAPGEQPGPQLDVAILAAAREHASAERRVAHTPFSRSWLVPASLTAVLVISVSLVRFIDPPAAPYDADLVLVPPAQRSEGGASPTNVPAEGRAVGPAAAPQAPRALPAVGQKSEPSEAGEEMIYGRRPAPTHRKTPAAPMGAEALRKEATPTPREAGVTDEAESLSPETWLARITTLCQKGLYDTARQELAVFRRQYPDHPIDGILEQLAPCSQQADPKSDSGSQRP